MVKLKLISKKSAKILGRLALEINNSKNQIRDMIDSQ